MTKIPYCPHCIYYKEEKDNKTKYNPPFRYCSAFPRGIPAEFFWNDRVHDYIVKEQEGNHYFHPQEEKKKFYKEVGFSFEGFEHPDKQKLLDKRQRELDYKLKNPPIAIPIKDDLDWVKQNIKILGSKGVGIFMLGLDEERVAQMEQDMLQAKHCTVPITLWKPKTEYLLVGGRSQVAYELCQKHNFEFDIMLLEFSSEQSVIEWIAYQYFTDPNTSKGRLGGIRFLTKKQVFFD